MFAETGVSRERVCTFMGHWFLEENTVISTVEASTNVEVYPLTYPLTLGTHNLVV